MNLKEINPEADVKQFMELLNKDNAIDEALDKTSSYAAMQASLCRTHAKAYENIALRTHKATK